MVTTLDIKGDPSPYHTVADIRNIEDISLAFWGVESVVHLAAIPGVKTSVENPELTFSSNVTGTRNVIRACEAQGVKTLIYASSSSVYDDSVAGPYKETHPIKPKSPYSASKIANEQDATASSIDATMGLRFFTVYGDNGRRDMAYSIFADAISEGSQIEITGANTTRDFTHVSTVANAIADLLAMGTSGHRIFNVCNGQPATLFALATHLGNAMLKPIRIKYSALPEWSASSTDGSSEEIEKLISLHKVHLVDGIAKYVKWHSSKRAII